LTARGPDTSQLAWFSAPAENLQSIPSSAGASHPSGEPSPGPDVSEGGTADSGTGHWRLGERLRTADRAWSERPLMARDSADHNCIGSPRSGESSEHTLPRAAQSANRGNVDCRVAEERRIENYLNLNLALRVTPSPRSSCSSLQDPLNALGVDHSTT